MNAQTPNTCAFEDTSTSSPFSVYNRSVDPDYLGEFEPVVFNIFFWSITPISDTTYNPNILTEEQCLTSVAQMNRVFNEFNIFFKYYGMDNYKSDTYYHITKDEAPNLWTDASNDGAKKSDSFNVYVASGGTEFGGIAQFYNKVNIVTHYNFYTEDDTMAHEIGHCFNLKHTHFWWDQGGSPAGCEFGVEHVTREQFLPSGAINPDWNADIAGDEVTDTPAMPDFRNEACYYDGIPPEDCASQGNPIYVYLDDYEYFGPGGDCLTPPVAYDLDTEEIKNYMAYIPNPPELFSKNFTIGQKIRMRQAIEEDLSGDFEDADTTIASLYEPYRGSYPEYYPHPQPWEYPKFQPGFEYRFVECECECPQPLPWYDTIFSYTNTTVLHIEKDETDYNLITHPNHTAIGIKHPHLDFWPQPRRCYDNYNTPPVIGGTVVLFNDGVFNNNVTITPQDSTAINNPSLIDNLQQGLYKIEKNYNTGHINETVIYKEN